MNEGVVRVAVAEDIGLDSVPKDVSQETLTSILGMRNRNSGR